jgi:hypothetical protein
LGEEEGEFVLDFLADGLLEPIEIIIGMGRGEVISRNSGMYSLGGLQFEHDGFLGWFHLQICLSTSGSSEYGQKENSEPGL